MRMTWAITFNAFAVGSESSDFSLLPIDHDGVFLFTNRNDATSVASLLERVYVIESDWTVREL
jgi:hypothetical protein